MYYFDMFDAVMFSIVMLLLIAFAVSVTHATMKVKLEVVQSTLTKQLNWSKLECSQTFASYLAAKAWRDAVINLCVVNHIGWDTNNPEATLAFLLHIEQEMALDPTISSGAAALILKAKREHGKKIRKAADRKLARTERDYERRIDMWKASLGKSHEESLAHAANVASARSELSMFQSIVDQELHNFIRLPSVRNACKKAINTNHKAWQEL